MVKKPEAKTAKDPSACIVILNWNGLRDTLACLKSVYELDYNNYQVVVVDNASKDNQADEIAGKYPQVHVIRNDKNLGFTGGCNQGIDYALKHKSDYVLLLNNDTIVTKGYLRKIVQAYQELPDAGMVSPLILYADRKRIWFAGGRVALGMIRHVNKGKPRLDVALPDEPFMTDYVPGTSLLISVKLIKKIGKLDDRYFAYYEDLDWCYKAQQLGYHSYVVPQAVIYHKKSGSTSTGGHIRFNKIPAYYIARNAVLFAGNLDGFAKFLYLLEQVVLKLPLSIALLIAPKAWMSYCTGLASGFFMLSKNPSKIR